MRLPGDLGEHPPDPVLHRGVLQTALVLEDYLHGVARPGRSVFGQEVGRGLRLGAGEGEVLPVVVAGRRGGGPDPGHDHQPQDEGEPAAAVGEGGDAGEAAHRAGLPPGTGSG